MVTCLHSGLGCCWIHSRSSELMLCWGIIYLLRAHCWDILVYKILSTGPLQVRPTKLVQFPGAAFYNILADLFCLRRRTTLLPTVNGIGRQYPVLVEKKYCTPKPPQMEGQPFCRFNLTNSLLSALCPTNTHRGLWFCSVPLLMVHFCTNE